MKLALNLPGKYSIGPVSGMPGGGVNRLEDSIQSVVEILLIIAVILTLFFLLWGGIQWITSGGDKTKIDGARKRIIFAVIGLIVAIMSFAIINIVGQILGVGRLSGL